MARRHRRVAQQHAVHGLRVVVGPDLQQVVAQRAQHLDLAPAQPGQEHEAVQRIVGGPLLVEGAQGLHETLAPLVEGGDAVGRRLDLEPIEEGLAALGQGEGHPQLVGDGEAQVLQGAQDVGEPEGAHRVEVEGRGLRGPREDAHLEPALQGLEVPDVLGHLLGRGGFAVEAAARLRADVALEEAPALAPRRTRGRGRLATRSSQVVTRGTTSLRTDSASGERSRPRGVEVEEAEAVTAPQSMEVEKATGPKASASALLQRLLASGTSSAGARRPRTAPRSPRPCGSAPRSRRRRSWRRCGRSRPSGRRRRRRTARVLGKRLKAARISRQACELGTAWLCWSSQSCFSLRRGIRSARWAKAPRAKRPRRTVAPESLPSSPTRGSRCRRSARGGRWPPRCCSSRCR